MNGKVTSHMGRVLCLIRVNNTGCHGENQSKRQGPRALHCLEDLFCSRQLKPPFLSVLNRDFVECTLYETSTFEAINLSLSKILQKPFLSERDNNFHV